MLNKNALRLSGGSTTWLSLAVLATSFCTAPPAFAAETQGCASATESRQFDFWLGDWNVTYPGATIPSSSQVSLDLGQCLLVESWHGGKGHSGKNMFAYSSDDKKWHGMFADNQGRVHVFEGKVSSGDAEFFGRSPAADGQAVLNRIRVVRVGENEVQQTWEKSFDQGATWTVAFRGNYLRKPR